MDLNEAAMKNRAYWDAQSDEYQSAHGKQLRENAMAWGVWSIPEAELHVLGEFRGRDVLEFGCGGAQWTIALAQRGARCVALDNSAAQLDHARRNMREAGVEFPLVHAAAEEVLLPDASFDIVFCDHGAMTFADPYRTVPEVARLLRPGGLLAFSAESPLHFACWNRETDCVDDRLHAEYFTMHASDDGSAVCYSLAYGAWIALFRRNGFLIEDLIELRPPPQARTTYADFVTFEWARKWPAEQIWRVRKE